MPSDNPTTVDIATGFTKGILEYGEDKIKQLIAKFEQGDLAFIEDEKTIEIVKAQRKKPEWALYRKYVKDPDLRLQIEMGFSLKQLENDKDKLLNLKDKIYRKYRKKGVHIAELTQNDILGRYVGLLLKNTEDEKEVEEKIEGLLHDVDKYVVFIQANDILTNIIQSIITRINALLPNAIIVFSRGKNATVLAEKTLKSVMKQINGYNFETQLNIDSNQRYDFIIKAT